MADSTRYSNVTGVCQLCVLLSVPMLVLLFLNQIPFQSILLTEILSFAGLLQQIEWNKVLKLCCAVCYVIGRTSEGSGDLAFGQHSSWPEVVPVVGGAGACYAHSQWVPPAPLPAPKSYKAHLRNEFPHSPAWPGLNTHLHPRLLSGKVLQGSGLQFCLSSDAVLFVFPA